MMASIINVRRGNTKKKSNNESVIVLGHNHSHSKAELKLHYNLHNEQREKSLFEIQFPIYPKKMHKTPIVTKLKQYQKNENFPKPQYPQHFL